MPFAQRNDPIEALPPQSPDQPFAKRVRLRTMHRRGDHLEAKVRQRSVQLGRKDPVVVVYDEAILVVGRDSFSQLLKRPGGGGMSGGVEVNQSTRGMLH